MIRLVLRFLLLVILSASLAVGLLHAQSDAPELRRVPSALANLTPKEINSIFGPAEGHATEVRGPHGEQLGLIPDFVNSGPENIDIPCRNAEVHGVAGAVQPTRDEMLYEASRKYDLIASGTVGPTTSFMLPDGGFLYSMMPFRVTDLVKNSTAVPVERGTTISVGREGGVLRVGNKSVTAVCTGFQLFQPGQQYLVFLQYVSKANVFVARKAYQFVNGKAAGMGVHGAEHWHGSGPPIAGMDQGELLQLAKSQAQRAAREDAKP